MSHLTAAANKGTVLHHVAMADEPRLLTRPGQGPQKAVEEPVRSVPSSVPAVPAPATPKLPSAEETRVLATQAGYEEGRREGHREGFELGHQTGWEKGLHEGREKGAQEGLRLTQASREALDGRIHKLDQLLTRLPAQFEEQMGARLLGAEEDMVALCFTVICRLLGDRVLSREVVVQSVKRALEQCCGAGKSAKLSGLLAIHVHPQDLELLKADPSFSDCSDRDDAGSLPWIPDDQIQLGGCIVRSEVGSLDARLETQLQALKALLMDQRETPDASCLNSGAGRPEA